MKPRTCRRPKNGSNLATGRKLRIVAWRRSNSDDGSVLVEFALVFPIFAIMLFGMVQFGVVFNGWTSLRNSVQTGARLGSINELGSDCASATSGSCTTCPQGNNALDTPPTVGADMYLGTANLVCTISGLIGQPVGTSINPTTSPAEADLLVQNGLLTVCSQAQAQLVTGFFPGMTLSTTSTFYIEPAAASVTPTVAASTVITGSNDTLTYSINGVIQTVAIKDNDATDPTYTPSELAQAIQKATNSEPPSLQLYGSTVPNTTDTIELATAPYAPYAELDVLGGTATMGTLDFSQTATDENNGHLESYDPDSIQACASPVVVVSAPSTVTNGTPVDPTAAVTGSSSSSGTFTFSYFDQQPTQAQCAAGGTEAGTAIVQGTTWTYIPNTTNSGFTPPPGDYWWYASFNGDPDNGVAESACGAGMPMTEVTP